MNKKGPSTSPLKIENEEKFLAALDIGSNSFHFVYARLINDNLQILHAEKYRVKLADGLDDNNHLSKEAISRGLATLSNLLPSTQNLTADNFRAVATFTLRQAKNAKTFLRAARKVFPFDLEIISGHEEARLIYQGVAQNSDANLRQLVVDIGGGSTEFVIGEKHNVKTLASLNIGCVSFQKQFFPDEKISAKRFNKAIIAAKCEIEYIVKRFQRKGWQAAVGTSGTIKAIYKIINNDEVIKKNISLSQLHLLKNTLIETGTVTALEIKGLKDNRRDVICSGLAVLIAVFEMLEITELDFCNASLREGVLYQQLDELKSEDIRQRSINSLATRFTVDQAQAEQVSQLAMSLFYSVQPQLKFPHIIYQNLLRWASEIHELGIDINTTNHHKHGGYIVSNADLSGFNQEQQQALAWLVTNQRKKISLPEGLDWHILDEQLILAVGVVLRLSVLLNQQRQNDDLPRFTLSFNSELGLELTCPQQWLLERPLVDVELFNEQTTLDKVGINLSIKSS